MSDIIAFMLAKDKLPFNFVEHEGFKALMQFLVPNYKVPGRTKITDMLDLKYEVLQKIVMTKLESALHISLTADIWTDPLNNKSYLGKPINNSPSPLLTLFPKNNVFLF